MYFVSGMEDSERCVNLQAIAHSPSALEDVTFRVQALTYSVGCLSLMFRACC